MPIFVDSRADRSIMDEDLAHQLGLEWVSHSDSESTSAPDGHLFDIVTYLTIPIRTLMLDNHHKTIQFNILWSFCFPLILGNL